MVNAPIWFAQQYALNIQTLLQQQGSRLRGTVMEGTHRGAAASPVAQMGAIAAQQVITRFAPMGRVDAPLTNRWVYPTDWDLPQLLDSFDQLRMIVDPKSAMVQNAAFAFGRQIDQLILNGITGTSQTGVNGATAVTFPTGQIIASNFASGADSGFTVAKLKQAKRLLMAAEVDLAIDDIYCAITAAQHDNLLNEAQIINSDYNGGDRPVLKEGLIDRFLGINFIHTEMVPMSGSYRAVPIWAKRGAYLGIWGDVQTSTSIRHDLQGEPWQAYAKMTMGATRLQEKMVVEVLCLES